MVSQDHGAWATAQEAPGTAALNEGGYAQVNQVSCASFGNCSAGGFYAGPLGLSHAFVIGQAHGTWDTVQQVPGLAALTQGEGSSFDVLSCAAPGRCWAGGRSFQHTRGASSCSSSPRPRAPAIQTRSLLDRLTPFAMPRTDHVAARRRALVVL